MPEPAPTAATAAVEPTIDPSRAAPEGKPAVIRATGLTKSYPGDIVAVDGIDMEVREGEIYGFLGPNGAGKSTTIGMLTTRVIPTSGQAEVGGVDVIGNPARAKQVIGVVPQTNTLDRAMTVAENLEFHGRYFGMRAKPARILAAEMLERVRLTDRAAMPVMALSGGMAQRLMVARAIMHEPRVLFLDEPTAGLDPQSRLALWDIMRGFHADGQTILLTTHYMEEADQLCDRVAIIDHGRFLALDTPEGLKASTGVDTIIRVTAEDGDLQRLADLLKDGIEHTDEAKVGDGVVTLAVQKAKGLLPRIIDLAEAEGYSVTDLSSSEPTLETVFIDLTGRDLRE
ncbi:ABC transporter ATP-binding protein [soil metagenome]